MRWSSAAGSGPARPAVRRASCAQSPWCSRTRTASKVALIACDVLMINRDVLDRAARRIEQATGIPFDHILINATHTHHAPTTATIHGYTREEGFTRQVEEKIVAGGHQGRTAGSAPVTFLFRLGEESSVGKNSRLLLGDGTIYWVGSHDDAVRPTGPFDPELPVLAFRRARRRSSRPSCSTTPRTRSARTSPGVRSPSFYGLAAQALEKERAERSSSSRGPRARPTTSTCRARGDPPHRRRGRRGPRRGPAAPGRSRRGPLKKEITVKVRRFRRSGRRAGRHRLLHQADQGPRGRPSGDRDLPRHATEVAPQQGESRKTWVQAVLIGDVAIVGVPGEFFTVLGQEIKRRSPFRYTYVFELANDYIGYIPDQVGFDRGGYQTWTGLHSFLERGTGELIVDEAVGLLERLAPGASVARTRSSVIGLNCLSSEVELADTVAARRSCVSSRRSAVQSSGGRTTARAEYSITDSQLETNTGCGVP